MRTTSILTNDVQVGDNIAVTLSDSRVVEYIVENVDMDGCWLEYDDGSSLFYKNNTSLTLILKDQGE
jgi:hypothetical protein